MKFVHRLIVFFVLTILTQIGGIIYVISIYVSNKWNHSYKFKTSIVFVTLYITATFIIVPPLASLWGRVRIQNTPVIQPANYASILLNRNYVRPKINQLLQKTARNLQDTPIKIHYLDANFPFINGFPLLPHLSHNDGKKIDLSLIYETKEGKISDKQKSISGYGVFVAPHKGEFNQTKWCKQKGYFQYGYTKYLTLGKINKELVFSQKGTKRLIKSILKNRNLGKIFIEPHLKNRLHLHDKQIRFQGCRAVRHDDHIHIQVK